MSSADIVQLFCGLCSVCRKLPTITLWIWPSVFFFCLRFKISVNLVSALWNKLADENPFSPTSCKIICGCSETLITKKPFSGRAEEWGHVLMNQTTLLSWLARSGFCCLSKFSTQGVTVRQKEEEREQWSLIRCVNQTACGLCLERWNHKERPNLIYTDLNVSWFCWGYFINQFGKVPKENISKRELHKRSEQTFYHISRLLAEDQTWTLSLSIGSFGEIKTT